MTLLHATWIWLKPTCFLLVGALVVDLEDPWLTCKKSYYDDSK